MKLNRHLYRLIAQFERAAIKRSKDPKCDREYQTMRSRLLKHLFAMQEQVVSKRREDFVPRAVQEMD